MKAIIKKKKKQRIDKDTMKRRKHYIGINLEEMSVEELEEHYQNAVQDWEEFKAQAKITKENTLMELYQ